MQAGSSSIGGAAGVVSIDGHGTISSSKVQTLTREETDAGAVMHKIQFYTTELHRLLDLVDGNKHTKQARKKAKKAKVESRLSNK